MTFQVHPEKWAEALRSRDDLLYFHFDIHNHSRFLADRFEVQLNVLMPKEKVRFGIMIEV